MSANVQESSGAGDAVDTRSATPVASVAEAARAGEMPPHRDLPDEIAIWEILVRLPPKALLRCRTVCRAWRFATSSRDFLLAHHSHQPTLPLLYLHDATYDLSQSLDIVPLDHRAGVSAADQLHLVARLGSCNNYMHLEASCDGLLVLATVGDPCFAPALYFSVCNPATRQYAPLPLLRGFRLAGMYPHPPMGEYRLLLYPDGTWMHDERPAGIQEACYVYTVGSCQPPRHIGWLEAEELIHLLVSVLCRGNLHWFVAMVEVISNIIMVFDATAEVFRQMPAPPVRATADLFEVDGMLGMASFNDAVTTIDIWMMQDYDSEVWAFKCRVELPVAELTGRFGLSKYWNLVVSSSDDNDVLILVQTSEWLLQIDIVGKLVAKFYTKCLGISQLRLKQTLVQHSFFPTIEGYVVNTWPFIAPKCLCCQHLAFPFQCGGAS
ncbi:F-box protein At5g49610 [Lolium perenne]|uniref:F-box protein At5g49610 n=1 Tax=Lolium perenne TaxID=4522 RepID=UPI0021F5172B|nr:F-box protein At5g49610-like [Lolium perenne]